jgi:RHS repeat-associated protein
MRRFLIALAFVLSCSAVHAQKIPSIELGFNADRVYQLGDVDHVNLFNGNLIVTLPIGKAYAVNGNLSYVFRLVYNSNAWDYHYSSGLAGSSQVFTESVPNLRSNAGMGWRLAIPRLIPPNDMSSTYPGLRNGWCYEDESGSEHTFGSAYNLAAPSDGWTTANQTAASVLFTTDGSNLRLVRVSATSRKVQFPDGTYKIFTRVNDTDWRLTSMCDGWGNVALLTYTYLDVSSKHKVSKITVTDSSGVNRAQVIDFDYDSRVIENVDNGMYVTKVTLAAFGGTTSAPVTAVYTFHYTDTVVDWGCNAQVTTASGPTTTVRLLTSVTLPDSRTYAFEYHAANPTGDLCSQGAMKKLTLPTGGTIAYTYQALTLPGSEDFCGADSPVTNIAAIRSRTVGADRWDYIQTRGPEIAPGYGSSGNTFCVWSDGLGEPAHSHVQPVIRWSRISVLAPPRPGSTGRSRSDYYFDTFNGPGTATYSLMPYDAINAEMKFGWPITAGFPGAVGAAAAPGGQITDPDDTSALDTSSSTRYLSEVHYDHCTTTGDCQSAIANSSEKGDGNRMRTIYRSYEHHSPIRGLEDSMASERAVYEDDQSCTGGCATVTDYSNFDGITHYQATTTSANFSTGSNAATSIKYYDTVAHSDSNSLDPSKPWLIDNYTGTTRTEAAQSNYQLVCFSPNGSITRTLTPKGTGSTLALDTKDLLADYEYDTNGNLVKERYFGGDVNPLLTTSIDCQTPLSSIGTPDYFVGHSWQYGSPNATWYATSSGTALTFKTADYDVDANTGLVKTSRDTAAVPTAYTWDAMGRLLTVTPTGTSATSYTYSSSGTPKADIAQGSIASSVIFDMFGRVSLETKPMVTATGLVNVSRTTTYDSLGRVRYTYDWGSTSPSATTYDMFGRPVSVTAPDASVTTLAYTGVSKTTRTRSVAGVSGALSSVTTEKYDSQGRLASVTEPSGNSGADVMTSYGYDVGNRLITAVTGVQTRQFSYDGRGFLLSEQHPELGVSGNGTRSYSDYDARGHATHVVTGPANGPFDLKYTFDVAERLQKVEDFDPAASTPTRRELKSFNFGTSNSPSVCTVPSSTCDARNGKLYSAVRTNYDSTLGNVAVTSTYAYTALGGRLSQVDTAASSTANFTGRTFTLSQAYDSLGMPSQIIYPTCISTGCPGGGVIGTLALGYNKGMLTTVGTPTTAGAYASNLTYQTNGIIDTVSHANGITETWGADPIGMPRPASITVKKGATQLWTSGSYAYDGSGNISAIGAKSYGYDGVNRLVSFNDTGVISGYTYDAFGNQTARTYRIRRDDHLTNVTVSIPVGPTSNHLKEWHSGGSVASTYDAAGNQLRWTTTDPDDYRSRWSAATWDALGPMHSLTTANGSTTYYLYDANDERLATVVRPASTNQNTTRWTVRGFGNELLRTWTDTAGVWNWTEDNIFRGTQLLASESPAGTRHFAVDHLGSPRVVTDGSGNLVGYEEFAPFGEGGATGAGSLQFTGHERDWNPAGGSDPLDYMHARWYASGSGRFVSFDAGRPELAQPQSWNRYAYVSNNPIKYLDSNGEEKTIYVMTSLPPNWQVASILHPFAAFVQAQSGFDFEVQDQLSKASILQQFGALDNTDIAVLNSHGGGPNFQTDRGSTRETFTASDVIRSMGTSSRPEAIILAGCSTQEAAVKIHEQTGVLTFGTTASADANEVAVAATMLASTLASTHNVALALARANAILSTPQCHNGDCGMRPQFVIGRGTNLDSPVSPDDHNSHP